MLLSNRSRPNLVLLYGALLLVLGFYAVAALRYPLVYIWATYEDLFGEWMQFWSVALACILAVRLATTRWRCRWFFALIALSCFYVAMEEISWGQRIFGFSSPFFFKANNLQGETNLHNFLTGPYATTLKFGLTAALASGMVLYGLVYPLLVRWGVRPVCWLAARGVAPPPLYLWPFFVVAAVLEWGPFRFNEAEVAELTVGLALLLTTIHYLTTLREERGADTSATNPNSTRRRLTVRVAAALTATLVLGVGTTLLVIRSPQMRERVERRIAAGVKKFASRYRRYEQWDTAAMLYRRAHENDPDSAFLLRRLAECRREMGDSEGFRRYAQQALDLDLKRLRKSPTNTSVHRSLSRTYRLLGDDERADEHLQTALRLALRRVRKNPHSASSAYALGQTYMMMGDYGRALEHLSRAYRLKPTSKRYRKAYFSARARLQQALKSSGSEPTTAMAGRIAGS
ncbi:MAG: tetratricopeptide repeat protein [Planctomycetota bacterium]|nr:MAG: tetratricopeptide repeat protein [Planctomycetota bacterium]